MKLKVIACVDFMGGGGLSPGDEIAEILKELKEEIYPDCEIEHVQGEMESKMETGIFPDELNRYEFNIYVFDFGGLMPGADEMIQSQYRGLVRKVYGNEDKLFILWSRYTEEWYEQTLTDSDILKEIGKENMPELISPNVVFRGDKNMALRCRSFFRLPKEYTPESAKRVGKLITPKQRPIVGE